MGAGGEGPPLLRFGIISDIQYADIPDGHSFHGTPRYYRNAMTGLQRAVDDWCSQGIDFAVHMGDIVDGFQPKDKSHDALTEILTHFGRLAVPHYHMIGNHCLYNLPRPELNERLGLGFGCPSGVSYYSVSPHPRYRFLFVDGYDVSVLGWPKGHPNHDAAVKLLGEKNPNENKNMPSGLEGVARRFVAFGGGISERQLEWIRSEVAAAGAAGQKVVACCHLGFSPGSCPNACLQWNYDEVLQALRETSPGTVVATMAGHSHQNGYVLDDCGIHHMVMPAVVETPPGRSCYGRFDLYPDRMQLVGFDTMMSLTLPFLDKADVAALKAQREQEVVVAVAEK